MSTAHLQWLGADTIPKAVSYTDHDTVLAVQKALKANGYDPGGLDGVFGSRTSKAIKAMQKDLDVGQTGVIDYGVLIALKVPAPANYTPTTTTAGRSASAAAKDVADTIADAATAADVADAAKTVEAANAIAAPPPPPDVQEKVAKASAAAKAAKTPEEVKDAKKQVKEAAQAVVLAESWWGKPLWTGAPVKRWHAVVGGSAALAVSTLLFAIVLRRKK